MVASAPLADLPTLFIGGRNGSWSVDRIAAVKGSALPAAERVAVLQGPSRDPRPGSGWVLKGIVQPPQYTNADEQSRLEAVQPPLGRRGAKRAALIPIKKSDEWWTLSRPRRREIFEERSHHLATGSEYLPAIARQLYHCRELDEPFDFLTWFEYAPQDAPAFEELVRRLRETPEWAFVEREVDIRLSRAA